MIDAAALRQAFRDVYGAQDGAPRLFRAPGRVNLIGEHTDYNEGFVLPMAIDRETCVAARPRADRLVRIFSVNLNEHAEFDLDQPGERERGIWLDYVEGVAQALERRGVRLGGADLALSSDVPVGAGLSSSAALEVSAGLALASVSGREVDPVELALAGQEAEHTYVGAKVGIMDQFIAALGRAGHALLIDCRTLETQAIPVDTTDTLVAICDTRVKHELAASEYNTRRAECEQGVELLRRAGLTNIRALRDVSEADLERYGRALPEVVGRRCRHVVSENARTLDAAAALRDGRLEEMGRLMYASHESLRDDYEVSCAELDKLVEIATSLAGATLGARMTGGGFGGCTVNLVRRDQLEHFRDTITREYTDATGRTPNIYVSEAGEGAGEVTSDE
ncbi:MAG: galactokinase [Pyrinomonadaceae bacterium]|nr:galactokinase [Pyrinomonadaceae bacterium]MDX6270599.1 galactokinase [Acidobacteriota bacterium]